MELPGRRKGGRPERSFMDVGHTEGWCVLDSDDLLW